MDPRAQNAAQGYVGRGDANMAMERPMLEMLAERLEAVHEIAGSVCGNLNSFRQSVMGESDPPTATQTANAVRPVEATIGRLTKTVSLIEERVHDILRQSQSIRRLG